jgi:hypothetical protein
MRFVFGDREVYEAGAFYTPLGHPYVDAGTEIAVQPDKGLAVLESAVAADGQQGPP